MKSVMTGMRPAVIVLLTAAVLSLPGAAAAGCLKEFGKCGDCAEQALERAFWDLDFGGMADAYVDGIDCDLDLMHCIMWAQHHDYGCGI